MSGGFIQIFMTRILDLVTDNNLKRWLQQGDLLRSQGRKKQHKRWQAERKLLVQLRAKITRC